MKEKKVMKLASEGKRLGAYCIDAIAPAVAGIMFVIAVAMLAAAYEPYVPGFGYGYGYDYGYGYGYGQGGGLSSGGIAATLIIAILLMIAYIAVQMVFYSKSKTLGKAALGLQVVSSIDGEPIGFWKMLFREWFVKGASGSVFFLGYIWVLVDEKNRGWHDKILDTYVIDIKESEALSTRQGYGQRRPEPKSDPVYAPEVAEAAGTSAASLADKEKTADAKDISAEAYDAAAPDLTEDAVVLENNGIRESALEVAEVIAVASQDAVRTSEGYDEIAAQTADEPGVSSDKATDESEEASDKAVDITEGE